MASSAPATSAKVVFGVSLVISLAFDLPKFITREPPPCIWFMMNKKISTMMTIGRKLTSRLEEEVLLRHVDGVAPVSLPLLVCGLQLVWRAGRPGRSPTRTSSACSLVRVTSMRWSLSMILALVTWPVSIHLMTFEVSAFS